MMDSYFALKDRRKLDMLRHVGNLSKTPLPILEKDL